MKIDGIATSEHLDSSGEILDIKGLDITDFEEGKGVLNFEHKNESPEDIVGTIIFAKKIYSEKDCEDDRQKMYWDYCKKPFLYIIGELFDGEKHPGAVALAALIRYYHNRGEKVLAGFSVEGQTLKREGQQLKRTVGRRVATTLRPCNKTCIAGVLEDAQTKDFIAKTMKEDMTIDGLVEVDSVIFEDPETHDKAKAEEELHDAIVTLNKTLTAGSYGVAPDSLTGGSALQVEGMVKKKPIVLSREEKNKLKSAIRDWPKTRPLKEWLKAQMPEVSESYIEHFADIADQVSLRKNQQPNLVRIDESHHMHPDASPEQTKLIQGLYWDPTATLDHDPEDHTGHVYHLQNDHGDKVLAKTPSRTISNNESARNASLYHNLATDYFGLGEHVPVTTHFVHPLGIHSEDGSSHWHATKYHGNTSSPLNNQDSHVHLQSARDSGTLHKLALMDLITGTDDRGHHNVLTEQDGKVLHIDNETAFEYHPPLFTGYMEEINNMPGIKHDSIHPEATEWLNSLSPIKLHDQMKRHGISGTAIKKSVVALSAAKDMAKRGAKLETIRHHVQALWNDVDSGRIKQ